MRDKAIYLGKSFARRLYWLPADLLERRKTEALLPPRSLSFVGHGDFQRTGLEYLEHFKQIGDLSPDDRVLDMGCGIGRMAIPLMDYLSDGSYAGFDVGKGMIRWCQRHISTQRPDFEFTWAPVLNSKYNPFGHLPGDRFRFPYEDDSFDFAFATSLFTHMTSVEIEHYLVETARVLRPGGTCLLTFFLLTPESREEMQAGRAAFKFEHAAGGGFTVDPRQPEEALAFDADLVRDMFSSAGLRIRDPLHFGLWSNTPAGVAGQDIVVAHKPG